MGCTSTITAGVSTYPTLLIIAQSDNEKHYDQDQIVTGWVDPLCKNAGNQLRRLVQKISRIALYKLKCK